jgi:hypothetical protein
MQTAVFSPFTRQSFFEIKAVSPAKSLLYILQVQASVQECPNE